MNKIIVTPLVLSIMFTLQGMQPDPNMAPTVSGNDNPESTANMVGLNFDDMTQEIGRIRQRSQSFDRQAETEAPLQRVRRLDEVQRQPEIPIPVEVAHEAPKITPEALKERNSFFKYYADGLMNGIKPIIDPIINIASRAAIDRQRQDFPEALTHKLFMVKDTSFGFYDESFGIIITALDRISKAIKEKEDQYNVPEFDQNDLEKAKKGQDKNLAFARLRGADLRKVNLSGANLFGADLRGAQLDGTNLDGACLYFTKLDGATIRNCNIHNARFFKVSLNGAVIENSIIEDTFMIGIQAQGQILEEETILPNGTVKPARIQPGITLQDVAIRYSILSDINGSLANWHLVPIENSILARISLTNSVFNFFRKGKPLV